MGEETVIWWLNVLPVAAACLMFVWMLQIGRRQPYQIGRASCRERVCLSV